MDGDRGGPAASSVIESDPDVMAGVPVFAGTGVPVQAFLDSIEGGWSLDEFLERFPGVRREQLIEMLRQGTRALLAQAGHTLGSGGSPVARDKIGCAQPHFRSLGADTGVRGAADRAVRLVRARRAAQRQ